MGSPLLTLFAGRRKRRAFTPLSLSPALWLDAADPATLFQDAARTTPAVSDGDPVGAWSDKSGNGRHCTQASATARPTLKVAIQNGRNVLRLDGVDDVLEGLCPDLRSAGSIYAVARVVSPGGAYDSYFGQGNGGMANWLAHVSASGGRGLGLTQAGVNIANSTVNSSVSELLKVTFSAGAFTFSRHNGASISGTLSVTSGTLTTLQLGASRGTINELADWLPLDLSEFVAFTSVLGAADDAAMISYLRTKWGTP